MHFKWLLPAVRNPVGQEALADRTRVDFHSKWHGKSWEKHTQRVSYFWLAVKTVCANNACVILNSSFLGLCFRSVLKNAIKTGSSHSIPICKAKSKSLWSNTIPVILWSRWFWSKLNKLQLLITGGPLSYLFEWDHQSLSLMQIFLSLLLLTKLLWWKKGHLHSFWYSKCSRKGKYN